MRALAYLAAAGEAVFARLWIGDLAPAAELRAATAAAAPGGIALRLPVLELEYRGAGAVDDGQVQWVVAHVNRFLIMVADMDDVGALSQGIFRSRQPPTACA